jgi:hypothetical protein
MKMVTFGCLGKMNEGGKRDYAYARANLQVTFLETHMDGMGWDEVRSGLVGVAERNQGSDDSGNQQSLNSGGH